MRSILRPAAVDGQPSARRRATSVALALAAHVLIALLLFHLAPSLAPPRAPQTSLETFSIAPGPEEATSRPTRTAARARTRPDPAAGSPPPPSTVPPPPEPVPTPPVDLSLFGDRALANAADLSRMAATGRGGEAAGTDTGRDSVAPYGPGERPGGQRLYNAEWQREPTNAELNGYLPNGAPPGAWALIACRTIEAYQVDNCRILGESPIGSGLAKAMRQAAWQFRVLPPRVGGRKQIGAWVRIRIDFGRAPGE